MGSQWLVECRAWCESCGWSLEARNAHGVGAQHSRRYGHAVRGEKSYAFKYGEPVEEPAMKQEPLGGARD